MKVRNTFIIFLVSGFWHGANWTFIAWGGLNALYFLPLLLLKRNRTNLGVVAEGRIFPSLRELFQMGTTFLLTVLAWVFFRVENISMAFGYIKGIACDGIFQVPSFGGGYSALVTLLLVLLFLVIEWINRGRQHALSRCFKNNTVRELSYFFIIVTIIWYSGRVQGFIYFQF